MIRDLGKQDTGTEKRKDSKPPRNIWDAYLGRHELAATAMDDGEGKAFE